MTAKALWVHECEKPKMYHTLAREVEYRTWYGFKRTRIEYYDEYERPIVRWECDVCRSQWEWKPMATGGFWWCNHRPEVWKDIEL